MSNEVRVGYWRGRQVALDGEVVWGEALVSSEHVTGEAAPARARPGARLPAGARNHDGVLVLAATAAASESTPARIARLAATAQARRCRNPNPTLLYTQNPSQSRLLLDGKLSCDGKLSFNGRLSWIACCPAPRWEGLPPQPLPGGGARARPPVASRARNACVLDVADVTGPCLLPGRAVWTEGPTRRWMPVDRMLGSARTGAALAHRHRALNTCHKLSLPCLRAGAAPAPAPLAGRVRRGVLALVALFLNPRS